MAAFTSRMVKRSSIAKAEPTWWFVGTLLRRVMEMQQLESQEAVTIEGAMVEEAEDAAL